MVVVVSVSVLVLVVFAMGVSVGDDDAAIVGCERRKTLAFSDNLGAV